MVALCCERVWFWICLCFFFKQKTAYEMRISDWSSDVCSSDLSISEMLGPRIASIRRVPGCGWPSISEMLGRRRVTAMSTARCGWPSISEMLGLRGQRSLIVELLRLALDL